MLLKQLISMEKIVERSNKSLQKRKFRFFTDLDSLSQDSSPASFSNIKEMPNNPHKSKHQTRPMQKIRDIIRRNYKFLTETQYSNPFSSSDSQQEASPKRSRSPAEAEANIPHKKHKLNETATANAKPQFQTNDLSNGNSTTIPNSKK